MQAMHSRIHWRCRSGWLCLAWGLAGSPWVPAQTLDLPEAERLALGTDPSIQSVQARQQALEEQEVAAGQLPDPMLKLGVMALPTDSFNLGQEPMTQVAVGVMQKFPRGDSRALKAAQIRERARSLGQAGNDLALRIRLTVREAFLEILKQQRLAEINREAEGVFRDLEGITGDYYATGRVPQQDVLRAAVEFARVQERAARIGEEEERARARLAAWIGEVAWRDLQPGWPDLPEPPPARALRDALPGHPRLQALQQEVLAAEKGVELVRQNYKPEFAVDLTYGGRGGIDPDGGGRSDLLSFMVTMDVPLFRARRQDRLAAASIAETSAAMFNRDDQHRQLLSEVEFHARTLERQRERLTLFEDKLLPDAKFNADATFEAYQAAVADLTTLMRARITEYDLQLDYVRLQAEALKTRARLLYLQGGQS